MTVRVNKPSFNIREKLSELGRKFGLKGSELAAAETVQEARDLVSAGRKNLVINGNMMISQRYGFNNPQNVANANNFYLDRFVLRENTDGVFQVRQSTPGYPFESAMQINVTTADTSISSSEYARIQYYVEGNDARAIDWGKSDSKDHLTLSFWVKSNAPGDYHVSIENSNNNYYPIMVKKYTIVESNAWQKVVVTFPPPGEYNFHRGNGIGLRITWSLAMGSSYNQATDGVWRTSGYQMSTSTQRNFMDTVGNDFYMTGVQLERGRNATDFEHRSFGEELALCQRYYCKSYKPEQAPGAGTSDGIQVIRNYDPNNSRSDHPAGVQFPVTMRDIPTITFYSQNGTANRYTVGNSTAGSYANQGGTISNILLKGTGSIGAVSFSTTVPNASFAYFHFTAESEL